MNLGFEIFLAFCVSVIVFAKDILGKRGASEAGIDGVAWHGMAWHIHGAMHGSQDRGARWWTLDGLIVWFSRMRAMGYTRQYSIIPIC